MINKEEFLKFINNLEGQEHLSDAWEACEKLYESRKCVECTNFTHIIAECGVCEKWSSVKANVTFNVKPDFYCRDWNK